MRNPRQYLAGPWATPGDVGDRQKIRLFVVGTYSLHCTAMLMF